MTDTARAMTTEELVSLWAEAKAKIDAYQRTLWEIERHIQEQMEADGATELVANGHTVTLKAPVSYDQSRLFPVLELLPESELVDAGAYSPEHQETVTVRAKWNLTKLKPFAKRGAAVREAIDAARVEGQARLEIKPVKE